MPATRQQRRLNLDRANEIRLARADLRRQVCRGELTVAELVLHPPEAACNWAIAGVLRCQPRWGTRRVCQLLARERINERKPLSGLTERQRHAVVARMAR